MKNRNIKKILLIQPPAFVLKNKSDMNPNVPLGLAYIAAVLEREGYEVRILDAFVEGLESELSAEGDRLLIGLTPADIELRLKGFMPDLVGVSSLFTMQRKNAHKVCEIVKRVLPDAVVVMGGAHPTAEPEMVLSDKNVDYVIIGEGEMSMLELVNSFNAGKDVSSIDGLCFRSGGSLVINNRTKFIEDLDSLPLPARHLLRMDIYFKFKQSHGISRKSPYASIVTSRGCPFGCSFCSTHTIWGSQYRFRSAANVLKEMRYLVDTYGIKELLFEDDNLTLNKKRAYEIFDGMIKERFDLIWRTPNGVAVVTLDKPLLDKMKASGCYQLGFAIESGCQRVLDQVIRKPLDLAKVPDLVRYARKIGIEVILFLVVGMPGETIDEMRKTFRFARKVGAYDAQHISIATPYPGSELFNICKKNNYFVDAFDYDRLAIRNANIRSDDWTPDDILKMVKEERRKSHLCCLFKDPVLFLKALVPELPKKIIKDMLKQRKATDAYSGS